VLTKHPNQAQMTVRYDKLYLNSSNARLAWTTKWSCW